MDIVNPPKLLLYGFTLATQGGVVTAGESEALCDQYGLGKPMYVQYLKWMGQMARGNFGRSFLWERSVSEIIFERLFLTATRETGRVKVKTCFRR